MHYATCVILHENCLYVHGELAAATDSYRKKNGTKIHSNKPIKVIKSKTKSLPLFHIMNIRNFKNENTSSARTVYRNMRFVSRNESNFLIAMKHQVLCCSIIITGFGIRYENNFDLIVFNLNKESEVLHLRH